MTHVGSTVRQAWSAVLLRELLADVPCGTLELELPDERVVVGRGEPRVRVRWSDRATSRVAASGMIGFGDAYVDGDWDVVEGSLLDLLSLFARGRVHQRVKAKVPRPVRSALAAVGRLGAKLRTDARNARFHYDVDPEFYRLWLDDSMTYTCGYAHSPDDSLEHMQQSKHALVADKLGLRAGHRLLDLGCGWGSFAQFAARRGASVTAVNVSPRQLDWIRQSGRMDGLDVELVLADFRAVRGTYDRVSAIGLAEHVGEANLPDLFRVISDRLVDGGLALVHTIGCSTTGGVDPWIERRIFPGSHVPTLSELALAAESTRMRVSHVENIGPHYALTLRHWQRRFIEAKAQVIAGYGEPMFRTWHLYLTALIPSFEQLSTSLFQMLVTKGEGPSPQLGLHTRPPSTDPANGA